MYQFDVDSRRGILLILFKGCPTKQGVKMRKIFLCIALLSILLVSLTFFGCRSVSVTYITNGGDVIEVSSIKRISEIPAPTRNGYSFSGWYADENFLGEPIAKKPKSDAVTLYAKWTLIEGTEGLLYELYNGKEEPVFVPPSLIPIFPEQEPQEEEPEDESAFCEYRVYGYTGTSPMVFLPVEYNGLPVTGIKSSAFSSNDLITEVVITNTVKIIGKSVFYNCKALKNVVLPEGLDTIPSSTFEMCSALSNVYIPDSVEVIGLRAFQNCRGLLRIKMPDELRIIEYYAFRGCNNLTEIIIPSKTSSIETFAFDNCTKLKKATILAETPPELLGNVFNATPPSLQIIVPNDYLDAYKTDEFWKKYNLIGQ